MLALKESWGIYLFCLPLAIRVFVFIRVRSAALPANVELKYHLMGPLVEFSQGIGIVIIGIAYEGTIGYLKTCQPAKGIF